MHLNLLPDMILSFFSKDRFCLNDNEDSNDIENLNDDDEDDEKFISLLPAKVRLGDILVIDYIPEE